MRLLVVEDDPDLAMQVAGALRDEGYVVDIARDGEEGHFLGDTEPYDGIILDLGLPGLDGITILERWRSAHRLTPVLILTARDRWRDKVAGFDAGADDYLAKPFHPAELRARFQSGARVVRLERDLRERVVELEDALGKVKKLQGLIPICSWCKKIRDDQDYWHQVDAYVAKHADVQFSHGICPTCYEEVMKPQIEQAKSDNDEK